MVASVSISIELSELVEFLCGIGNFGINGLPGVFGLSIGVGVLDGSVGECFGERMGDPSGVLCGDRYGVSFGLESESNDDKCSGDL